MNASAVAATGLVKQFGALRALRGLDFEIPQGSVLAVVGPNGAGKSTLLRLLAGLARPSQGEIRIHGDAAQTRRARARVGYIGHATLLYPELTARENLRFAAKLYALPDASHRVERLLDEHGLASVGDRPVAGFSRGMAQRIAIARGLIHDPSLVLLDEPFTGLDRKAAQKLVSDLQAVRGGGRTVVVVTHDLAHCLALADRVMILVRGQIFDTLSCSNLSVLDLESQYLAAVGESR